MANPLWKLWRLLRSGTTEAMSAKSRFAVQEEEIVLDRDLRQQRFSGVSCPDHRDLLPLRLDSEPVQA